MRLGVKLALLAVTLATVWLIAAGLPGIVEIPGWFPGHRPLARGLGEGWALAAMAVAATAGFLGVMALLRRGRQVLAGWALLLGAWALGLLMVPLDSRGLDGAWERHVEGHGELLRVAHARSDRWVETLRRYETLAHERKLGVYAPSKPPGALGAYMALDRVARWEPLQAVLAPLSDEARDHPKLERVADTAALSLLAMPLGTALVAPLLLALGVLVFRDARIGAGAAVLWMTAPSVLLISHHLDGALYPALAAGGCALGALGVRRGALGWTALAGAVFGVGLYTSFSLLPALALAMGLVLALALAPGDGGLPLARRAYDGGWHLAVLLAAVLGVAWLAHLALGFEPALRLSRALDYHERWKRTVPTWPWRGWALLEFALYAGFPLVCAWLARSGLAVRRLVRRRVHVPELAATGLTALVLLLSLTSGTNEVARMWLLLVPFVALVAATGLCLVGREGRWREPLAWLGGCQLLVALVLEANQPW